MRPLLPLVPMLLMYASFLTLQWSQFPADETNSSEITAESGPIGEWWFIPDYRLPGRAGELPSIGTQPLVLPNVKVSSLPLQFHSQLPTERCVDLLETDPKATASLPTTEFSVEMWSMYHVDRPVGALIAGRANGAANVPWSVGFFDWEASVRVGTEETPSIDLKKRFEPWTGFKERWFHVVANFQRDAVTLYVNGELIEVKPLPPNLADGLAADTVEIAAYLQNEPYMELGNLVRAVRIWDQPLSAAQIQVHFSKLCEQVEQGVVHPNDFHFKAPPSLQLADRTSINLIWETDRPATAELKWGKTADFEHSQRLESASRLHETTILNLDPSVCCMYQRRVVRSLTFSIKTI